MFSAQDLADITDRYTGRYVSTQELQQLRHELTRYYIDRGYLNSGAVIPDQTVQDGVIKILIIEGRMESIEVTGTEHFRERYVRERIEANADSPLRLDRLQESLQLLLESPRIERIHAELRPGSRPGLALLKAQVTERTPYQLGLVFDNQIAPSVGEYEGTVFAAHNDLTGNGDVLSAQGRFAGGLTGYGADYWLPVNRYDTSLHAWYTHYDAHIIEEPFNEIDVASASESYGVSLSHPFYRKPGNTVSGSITLERRRSNTALLGGPFSFSPGVQEGKTSLTVIRIGQEWIGRGTDQVFALRSSFNIGVDAIDATINTHGPDGRFFSWLGQFQWARRIGPAQLIWRGDVHNPNHSVQDYGIHFKISGQFF